MRFPVFVVRFCFEGRKIVIVIFLYFFQTLEFVYINNNSNGFLSFFNDLYFKFWDAILSAAVF